MYKLGEYPIVAKFPFNVGAFSVTFYGAQENGDAYIKLYRSDGTIISEHILQNVGRGPYGFTSTEYNIKGFSVEYISEVGGLAIYSIRYNKLILSPYEYKGALAAAAIAANISNLEHTLDYPGDYSYSKPWLDYADRDNILYHFSGGGAPETWTSSGSYTQEPFNLSDEYYIQGYVGNYVGDSVYLLISFLDSSDNLIESLRVRGGPQWGGTNYKMDLYYSEAAQSETAPGESYPQLSGRITFDSNNIIYTSNDSAFVEEINSHTVPCNTTNIAKIVVSDLKIYINHYGYYPQVDIRFGLEGSGENLPANIWH